ncbi:hypothetical protein J2S43_001687 [Catenuloplanes nepalensis]|uniref:Uncharacterized protein n=1 Tax=Catenuloplanes nepalensis TaxID=587533 RepID=A0ABT9MP17_9ACTN|nr:hypothetical protein [Catenuloplanes nepalensis]MDP9793175.1 hypothetical protein [Catenuloplanes nepalensis]
MDAAKPREFDRDAFIAAVEEAIAKRAPKNLKEADEFGDSPNAGDAAREVQSQVDDGTGAAATEIATTTAAPPDTSKAVDKKVVPLAADRAPGAPATPDPAGAIPDKLPPAATDTSAGPKAINAKMAANRVTEKQLQKSGEPPWVQTVADKHAAEQDAVRTQAGLRAHEARTLAGAKGGAARTGAEGMKDFAGARNAIGRRVTGGKQTAKGRDETRRAQVTATLQRVFDATKKDVEDILTGLDTKVDAQFTREEKAARDAFTSEHKRKMADYKDRRYSGPVGKLRWFDDWLTGLPDEANTLFVEAREHYVTRMRTVIGNIADTVAAELKRAKQRIATGRADLKAAVEKLPADLRAIGREAATGFADRFAELDGQVADKGTELVDTLAEKYTTAMKAVDDEIVAEKERNKGVVQKVAEAVGDAIDTIMELKDLLLGVLAKAAQAALAIIADPIGFLGNLVAGVGAGLRLFLRNIGRHLQAGVLQWLLGVGAGAGLKLPSTFDARGILLLLASLLGLTWQNIRVRITRKVPDQAVTAAESSVPLIGRARREGVGGLWEELRGRVGDLRQQLIGRLVSYLVPTIITAGITWVLSLLNPASAFIRACKLIIDIVLFVVRQARQIIDFVNAVLDAVIAIARGGGGGVPGMIQNALARAIPVLIGFLAALLGIGGVAGRVRRIFQELARPVNRAVDQVVDRIVSLIRPIWNRLKAKTKIPPRVRPGAPSPRPPRDSDRRRPDRGRATPRTAPDRRRRAQPDERTPAQQMQALRAALREAHALVKPRVKPKKLERGLERIRRRHRLTELRVVLGTFDGVVQRFHFHAAINPQLDGPDENTQLEPVQAEEDFGILIENQRRFQAFADGQRLVIDVRPTNPRSVPHLKEGAWYKPVDIKAKTINEADTFLTVEPAKMGLVGFFLRRVPEPMKSRLSRAELARAKDRRRMRTEERHKYASAMMKLRRGRRGPGHFEVIGYVVHGFEADGTPKPIAGDHDLYDLRFIDGSEMSKPQYDRFIARMQAGRFGVMHGAVVRWETTDPKEIEMREKLVAQHRRAGNEGLVRFTPGETKPRFVYAETDIAPPAG